MSFSDGGSYDFNGVIGLLNACLKNVNKYAIYADFYGIRYAVDISDKDL
ncbi:MAG: hypothetical protein K1562_16600 [Candidatus Thiodiazotropha sp. (ex. Lucinisca nassula)]|nr:hypothetical protein [Candidatus Thiodiazotropha sp. (ex. Lucinisca nassula)]